MAKVTLKDLQIAMERLRMISPHPNTTDKPCALVADWIGKEIARRKRLALIIEEDKNVAGQ